jgi:UDP-N-acetylglucosamine 3-dehydrogenase
MDRLRIAVVGAGPVAQRYHMPAIRGVPEVRATAVVDVNAERARNFAARYDFPSWTTQIQELVGKVDVAVVALPNGLHASVSCELLSNGIHVLCEKPMARNVAECQSMTNAARRGGAQLCIGHNRRFTTNMRLLKQLLDKGLIGDIVQAEAIEGSKMDWPRSPAYFDPVQSGGGSLMDVGIHSIDLIRWFAGEFQHVEYQGNATSSIVESEAEMRFRLANGAQGTLIVSRSRELDKQIKITGSEGYAEVGLWSDDLKIRSNKGKAFEHFKQLEAYVSRRPPANPSFVLQLGNLVNAIRGKEKVLVDGAEGMAAVNVACCAYASASGSPASFAAVSVESR